MRRRAGGKAGGAGDARRQGAPRQGAGAADAAHRGAEADQARSASRPSSRCPRSSASTSCASSCARSRRSWARATTSQSSSPSCAQQIEKAGMPKEAEDQAKKELKRLERMPEASAEYGMIRTYLDWLIELPWSKLSEDTIDIAEARRILDEDHYGLPKVKRRILEYLAVRKLNPEGKSPILCFVGPPGVGKTSLGQSIARATGRKFVRAEPRRRARRGRDPRPPPHLYRRAARQHHPVDPQGRDPQSGVDARRGRQARRRLPRRSVLGAARGARPRAELDLPRQLSRRRLRPVQGDVHRHRQRARHHPRAGARPHGDHRDCPATPRTRSSRSPSAICSSASSRRPA